VKGVLISHIRDCDNALKGFGATSVQYERGFNVSCLRNVAKLIIQFSIKGIPFA
jgi:hypothetical protein